MTILMTFDPSPTEIGDRVAVSAETYSITTTGRYDSKENAAYQWTTSRASKRCHRAAGAVCDNAANALFSQ
jgi:hypothetical protein